MKRFVKPERDPHKTLVFILIAGLMMVSLDFANTKLQEWQNTPPESELSELYGSEIKDYESAKNITKKMKPSVDQPKQVFLHIPQPDPIENKVPDTKPVKKLKKSPEQKWRDHAATARPHKKKARIVIIIDDLGMDRKRSNQIIDIQPPLTLAFLPYAPNLEKITQKAKNKGHELLIHTPMEPLNQDLNPGPVALLTSMDQQQINQKLDEIFTSFEGYVGINNHMGSKLTQNEPILHLVMNALAERGLIYVDSKTIHTSIAADIAREHGLDYAERDVFLDHEDSIEFVRASLRKTEQIARRNGSAIAIGHPKDITIQALKEWIPTLEEKGLVIVPVSAVVKNSFSAGKAHKVGLAATPVQ